jgi:hypothetical protein
MMNRGALLAAYYSPQSIDESALNHPKNQGNYAILKKCEKDNYWPIDSRVDVWRGRTTIF